MGVRVWSMLALTSLLVLAGCSSTENFEEPAPVPQVVGGVTLEQAWSLNVGDGHDGQFLQLRPEVVGGTLYAVSADGVLLAVGPATGDVRWRKDLDQQIMAGVGADSRQLYLVNDNARLLALSRDDGELVWEARLPNEALAEPRSNGRLVIAQTVDGKVLAFDVRNGEMLWQYESSAPALSFRGAAAPVVGSEMILASFSSGALVALAADNGQPVWQYAVGEPSGRTELERLVDVTAEPIVIDSAVLVAGYQGKLALVDLRSGQEIWSRSTSTFHSPGLSRDRLFISMVNGDLVAMDGASLNEVWRQDQLAWRRLTGPLVVSDYVLVGDVEGYVHVVSQRDGGFEGQLRVDKKGIRSPLLLWEDKIIVYGNGGRLGVYTLRERN